MAIATLIAAGRLDERLASAAMERLPGAKIVRWIEPGSAADLEIPDPAGARSAMEGWEAVDLIVAGPGPRLKKLLVADMDSTMIGQECIDELAAYAGVGDRVAAITERAMQGELDFVGALAERVALLAGLDEAVIGQCLAERIRPSPGAATLIGTMAALGSATVLVSGGFTAFVGPIARQLGFGGHEANRLEVEDGRLTGNMLGPIVDSARKKALLVEQRERLGLARDDTMAIGDGANDRLMLVEAGLGIAFRAKPALVAVADSRLDHHGLDALLWAQGIERASWVEA